MINFKKPEISDKTWMDPLLAVADLSGCHQNFTNIFAWSGIYNYQVARVEEYLVVKGYHKELGAYYFYPAGQGEIMPIFLALQEDAQLNQEKMRLVGISPDNKKVLDELFPGRFSYQDDRDGYDYVYHLEKLVSLAGKKLQAKRNHINKFKTNNDDWCIEELSEDNLAECWKMNEEWCKANGCKEDEQLSSEYCAVRVCFENYEALGIEGILLRLEGRIIAFTMGERLNSDTYVTHVEKAFGEIQGAYQMINREFAELIQQRYPDIVYVNREEDMGYEGLRKAKMSYRPITMEKKLVAEDI